MCAVWKNEGNDVAKRWVFRRRLKVPSVSDAVTLDGKVFQTRGAASGTKNARSPIVVRHEDGVTRADVDEDRSLFLVSTSATRHSSLARYGGAVPCRHRKTRTESLNSIRSGTRSQWRSRSSGVMCSYFHAEQTSRAAAFITDCSLSSWLPIGRVYKVDLPKFFLFPADGRSSVCIECMIALFWW